MKAPESWEKARKLLEAALFASGDIISDSDIEKITGLTGPAIEKAISEINESLSSHPFYVERVEDGWIMVLRREFEEKVAHLFPQRILSKSEMRTLALIAANEPVTISEIVRIRGNFARQHIRRLMRLGLVRENRKGRMKIYRTTKKFSLLFKVEKVKENGSTAGDGSSRP